MMPTPLRLRTATWLACVGMAIASVSGGVALYPVSASPSPKVPSTPQRLLPPPWILSANVVTTPLPASEAGHVSSLAFQSSLVLFLLLGIAIFFGLSQTGPVYARTQLARLNPSFDTPLEAFPEHTPAVEETPIASATGFAEAKVATLMPALAEAEIVYPEVAPAPVNPTVGTLNAPAVPLMSPADAEPEPSRLTRIDAVQELIGELQSSDGQRRQRAIWQLAQVGNSQALQPLVDLLLDSDSQQRSLILAAMSEIGARSLKPLSRALLTSLQDDNPEVRINAIRDITRVYEQMSQISHLLSHALSDPDPEVQETAHWALAHLSRLRIPLESSLRDEG